MISKFLTMKIGKRFKTRMFVTACYFHPSLIFATISFL
jgi:hypothetical protein